MLPDFSDSNQVSFCVGVILTIVTISSVIITLLGSKDPAVVYELEDSRSLGGSLGSTS